jgi:hypothetical protein
MPANIKVRPDGMVKVLDFCLAKAVETHRRRAGRRRRAVELTNASDRSKWRGAHQVARRPHGEGAGSGEPVGVANPVLAWIYAATFLTVSSVDSSSSVEGRRLTL